jgi:hypothetical protein
MKKINHWLLIACFLIPFGVNSQAPFKSGNIVVVRLGDGSAIDPQNPTVPMFLDEYTPTGAFVQSVALPTVDNGSNLRMSQVFYNGDISLLTLSPNKEFLTLVGFKASPGTSTSGINSSSFDRTIAKVDYNGAVNSSTAILGTDVVPSGTTGFPMSVITDDGTRFWTVHESALGGGIRYSLLGQSTSTNIITSSTIKTLNIDNGQLYCTRTGRPTVISGGLPTTGPQTATPLPGIASGSGSSSQMFLADLNPSIPGFDVIYFTDNNSYALSKFSFDQGAGVWVLNGTIGVGDDYRGITGVVNGTTVTLYATRKIPSSSTTAGGELVTLTDNTGHTLASGSFTGTPTIIATPGANKFFKGVAMAPQPLSVSLSTKIFLQGAYNSGLSRHKDVTTTWASTLNANALSQPFAGAPFNYAGTESVINGFFTSTAGTTDITDWVLLELHDATTPSTIVARQAAFVREDGKVVGLDGISDPTFTGVGANNYYIVIKHRNHLPVRSSTTVFVNGATPVLYDFTTAQAQAYQDPAILTNAAMKDLSGGVFGMFAGNANANNNIRFTGLNNDAGVILTALGGNQGATASGYNMADLNLDGTVRFTGLNNDAGVLLTALNGNQSNLFTQHQ